MLPQCRGRRDDAGELLAIAGDFDDVLTRFLRRQTGAQALVQRLRIEVVDVRQGRLWIFVESLGDIARAGIVGRNHAQIARVLVADGLEIAAAQLPEIGCAEFDAVLGIV